MYVLHVNVCGTCTFIDVGHKKHDSWANGCIYILTKQSPIFKGLTLFESTWIIYSKLFGNGWQMCIWSLEPYIDILNRSLHKI